jgi:Tol biopolymer transport system component
VGDNRAGRMVRRLRTGVAFAAIAASTVVACGEAPLVPEPKPVYDLLYEAFISSWMLRQSIDGGEPTAPVPGVTIGIDPTASADGRFIAYGAPDTAQFSLVLTVYDRRTNVSVPIGTGNDVDEQPAFSNDGSRIAYASTVDAHRDIYVVNRDGTGRKKLTTDPQSAVVFDYRPVWSPDGTQIAWSSNEHGQMNVWVMNADGSNKHRLTATPGIFEDDPAWSPDGKRIVYFEIRSEAGVVTTNLVSVGVNGADRKVYVTPGGGSSRHPVWSPDGALIAFTFLPSNNARPQIYTMNADGSDLKLRTFDGLNRGALHAAFIRR